jgi:hypothetical protein
MSITHTEAFVCTCGATVEASIADSLNAARHPNLKELLFARELHRFRCAACGSLFVVDKALFYFDMPRRQFVCVFPPGERADEAEHIRVTLATFDKVLGAEAPAHERALSGEFLLRLCYGYEELREKIAIDDAGLADLTIESLKLNILRQEPWFAEHQVLTVRFDHIREDGSLLFHPEWIDGPPDEESLRDLAVERSAYDALDAEYDQLLARCPGLANGPHCSLLRLIDWSTVENPWAARTPTVTIARKVTPGDA